MNVQIHIKYRYMNNSGMEESGFFLQRSHNSTTIQYNIRTYKFAAVNFSSTPLLYHIHHPEWQCPCPLWYSSTCQTQLNRQHLRFCFHWPFYIFILCFVLQVAKGIVLLLTNSWIDAFQFHPRCAKILYFIL